MRSRQTLLALSLCASLVFALAVPAASIGGMAGPAFVYPLVGTRVSSDYGLRKHPLRKAVRHHHGIDLAAPEGALIRSIQAGKVVFADPYSGYGNLVVVQHENGMTSHYGHCRTIKVRPGQRVNAGEIIATVGSTGKVTGPHLHFEIRIGGKSHDPEMFIPGLAVDGAG
jgi:murein DD-endopeptidase MepM/ murein hydrolase activator NlpD